MAAIATDHAPMPLITLRTALAIVLAVALACGVSAYAWLDAHPAIYEPLTGAVLVAIAAWVCGSVGSVATAEAFGVLPAREGPLYARAAFFAFGLLAGTLIAGALVILIP